MVRIQLNGTSTRNVRPIIIDLILIGWICVEFAAAAYIIDLIVRSI